MSSITQSWFGKHFAELHPDLQTLHAHGGTLSGNAYVDNELYNFNVTLFKRGLGLLVQYKGSLKLDT